MRRCCRARPPTTSRRGSSCWFAPAALRRCGSRNVPQVSSATAQIARIDELDVVRVLLQPLRISAHRIGRTPGILAECAAWDGPDWSDDRYSARSALRRLPVAKTFALPPWQSVQPNPARCRQDAWSHCPSECDSSCSLRISCRPASCDCSRRMPAAGRLVLRRLLLRHAAGVPCRRGCAPGKLNTAIDAHDECRYRYEFATNAKSSRAIASSHCSSERQRQGCKTGEQHFAVVDILQPCAGN